MESVNIIETKIQFFSAYSKTLKIDTSSKYYNKKKTQFFSAYSKKLKINIKV